MSTDDTCRRRDEIKKQKPKIFKYTADFFFIRLRSRLHSFYRSRCIISLLFKSLAPALRLLYWYDECTQYKDLESMNRLQVKKKKRRSDIKNVARKKQRRNKVEKNNATIGIKVSR